MISKAEKRVAFNDSFVNFKEKTVPQGGPSRFAMLFRNYFSKKNYIITGILFSEDVTAKKISTRKSYVHGRSFQEILLPKAYLRKIYKRNISKIGFLKHLEPGIKAIGFALRESGIEIVFLNGFSLSNWAILEAAHRLSIPVIIQHAGIWKKEVMISQKESFSKEIKELFYQCEKDIVKKAHVQIFLNNFSKKVFSSLHNVRLKKTVVIPLPFLTPKRYEKFSESLITKKNIHIGSVGRWDAIKNHAALMRLGVRIKKTQPKWSLSVVTQPGAKASKDFLKLYLKFVNIVRPMHPENLAAWYKSIDVLVVPSNFDVSPTVVLEAVAYGKPVIISNQTGWADIYRTHGLQKLIITADASGAEQEKVILYLQKNWNAYKKKFEKLQKKLMKDHDPKTVFRKYDRLISSLKSS
jgi:glycosyltransferase involved in cell wall biosynthesis